VLKYIFVLCQYLLIVNSQRRFLDKVGPDFLERVLKNRINKLKNLIFHLFLIFKSQTLTRIFLCLHFLVCDAADPVDGAVLAGSGGRLLSVALHLDALVGVVLGHGGALLRALLVVLARAAPLHRLLHLHVLEHRNVPVVDPGGTAVAGEAHRQQTTHVGRA
jgi:hypothetical protein